MRAALAYTGYLKSVDYAKGRPQGRPAGAKDQADPMVPIVRHADVRRMLLAQKAYAEGALRDRWLASAVRRPQGEI